MGSSPKQPAIFMSQSSGSGAPFTPCRCSGEGKRGERGEKKGERRRKRKRKREEREREKGRERRKKKGRMED